MTQEKKPGRRSQRAPGPRAQPPESTAAARVRELEARLARSELDQSADAELIGRLYAEVASRDAIIKGAQARSSSTEEAALARLVALESELELLDRSYADAIVELEAVTDRHRAAREEAERLRVALDQERAARESLEQVIEVVKAELSQARAHTVGAKRSLRAPSRSQEMKAVFHRRRDASIAYARTELAWLCEAVSATLGSVRASTIASQRHLEETRTVIDKLIAPSLAAEAREMRRGIGALIKNAESIDAEAALIEEAIARASGALDGAREPNVDLDAVDERAQESTRALVRRIGSLRELLAPLARGDEDEAKELPSARRAPPLRRARPSRMPPP